MHTIGKPAMGWLEKDILEVVGYFLRLKIKGAESFYSGYINQCTSFGQIIEFAEGCGMHTRIVIIGNLSYFCMCFRNQTVDKGTLADTWVAGYKSDFVLQQRIKNIKPLACKDRSIDARVANGGVELVQLLYLLQFFIVKTICLVEKDSGRNAISFRRG